MLNNNKENLDFFFEDDDEFFAWGDLEDDE